MSNDHCGAHLEDSCHFIKFQKREADLDATQEPMYNKFTAPIPNNLGFTRWQLRPSTDAIYMLSPLCISKSSSFQSTQQKRYIYFHLISHSICKCCIHENSGSGLTQLDVTISDRGTVSVSHSSTNSQTLKIGK